MTSNKNSSNLPANTLEALQQVPSIPRHDDGPVFSAPWEAEAFAMTLTLYEQGLFTWKEWAAELSKQIATAQSHGDPDLGDTYYHHWLAALEAMVVQKKIGDADKLSGLYHDWSEAAKATPHGEPITLGKR